MKKLLLVLLLIASPTWAQTKLTPKDTPKDTTRDMTRGAAARGDNCAPIGRTANGELVYSMKCENLPAPPSPPPQAEREAPPPAPEPQMQRSGLFGWSYEVKRPEQ